MNVRLPSLTVWSVAGLLAACAGGPARRVETSGVALGGSGNRRGVVATEAQASGGELETDVAPSFEATARDELASALAGQGKSALERVEPGSTLESHLRFVMSRIMLGRFEDAETVLDDVVRKSPECALAHLLLGRVRRHQGRGDGAVVALRRARALWVGRGQEPHPDLGIELAVATLLAGQVDEGVALLREELATGGANRLQAAVTLVRFFADRGEFESALAVVDSVLDDQPEQPAMVVAKIDLLVDQLRYDEAAALIESAGGRLAPATRLHLRALVSWRREDLAGAVALAREAVAALEADAHDPQEAADLRAALARFEGDLSSGRRRNATYRELLGRLRYSPREVDRLQAMRLLCDRGTAAVFRAAILWGLADAAVSLRAYAYRAGIGRHPDAAALVEQGLRDPSPAVRTSAAAAILELPGDRGQHLLDVLATESDPDAFLTMHRLLRQLRGASEFLPYGGEQTAEGRAQVVERWRRELSAGSKGQGGA